MNEKPHPPSAKRLQEARSRGQVVRSTDMVALVQLGVVLLYFQWDGLALWCRLTTMYQFILTIPFGHGSIVAVGVNIAGLSTLLFETFWPTLLTVTGLVILSTTLILILQVGFLFSPRLVLPLIERINPLLRLKEIVSIGHLLLTLKGLVFAIVIISIFVCLFLKYAQTIKALVFCGSVCALPVIATLTKILWQGVLAFFLFMASLDWLYHYRHLRRRIQMSHEEVLQEQKEIEGNPEIRQRQREKHRNTAESETLRAVVGRSTVVIRNPTHCVVCLWYEFNVTPLPKIIEKAHGAKALLIIRLAEQARIPIVEHRIVARGLMLCANGQYIPSELFEPIAEILHWVQHVNKCFP